MSLITIELQGMIHVPRSSSGRRGVYRIQLLHPGLVCQILTLFPAGRIVPRRLDAAGGAAARGAHLHLHVLDVWASCVGFRLNDLDKLFKVASRVLDRDVGERHFSDFWYQASFLFIWCLLDRFLLWYVIFAFSRLMSASWSSQAPNIPFFINRYVFNHRRVLKN